MKRRLAAIASALLLVGSGAPLGAQTFVILQGGDTVGVERVTRGAGTFEGEMQVRQPNAVTIRYRGTTGADALIPSLTMETPGGSFTVTFRGDSAFADVGGATQRLPAAAGALPFSNTMLVLLEQVLIRSRVVGGDRVEQPLLNLSGGQVFRLVVQRVGADSVTLTFPDGVEVRARIDAEGRLLGAVVPSQGLEIRRAEGPIGLLAPPPPPDYSAPPGAPYRAEEVRVEVPAGHVLAGTLTIPGGAAGPVPAVLLVTGSGAQDRDAALPLVRGYRLFREVADTLSRRGIAVLRLDDRGFGGSSGDASAATTEDLADDARAALEFLRRRKDVDPSRLGVVGHSEGGVIAPMVAADGPPLRAIVLMAGTSRPGREVLEYQLRNMIGRAPGFSASQRDSALAGIPAMIAARASNAWMRYFLEYDPLPVLGRVKVPVLVLQGATDRQVTADQAEEIATALRAGGNSAVTVRVFPDVNHLFLPDPSGYPQDYAALPPAVSDAVLGTLADWLAREL